MRRQFGSVLLSLSIIFSSLPVRPASAQALPSGALTPPEALGTVAERFTGDSHRKVVLIQDLHAHLDTQQKIAGLLRFYDETMPVRPPFALEGVHGIWDLSLLDSFPKGPATDRFFDDLLKEAALTGPERYVLGTHEPRRLIGVDDGKEVVAQRALFTASWGARRIAAAQLAMVQSSLDRAERVTFSRKLRKWKTISDAFQTGSLYPDVYFHRLQAFRSEALLPHSLLELSKATSRADAAKLLTSDRFYSDLRAYGQAVGQSLSRSEDEKRLVQARFATDLLNRLFRQQLTMDEIRLIASRQDEIAAAADSLLRGSGSASWFNKTSLLEMVRLSTDFYASALVRDNALAANTIALLNAQPSADKSVILVAGGFHTAGITQELKKQGISYEVISPNLVADYTDADEARYGARLSGAGPNFAALSKARGTGRLSAQAPTLNALLPVAQKLGFKSDAEEIPTSSIRSMYGPEVADAVQRGINAITDYRREYDGAGVMDIDPTTVEDVIRAVGRKDADPLEGLEILSVDAGFMGIPRSSFERALDDFRAFSGGRNPFPNVAEIRLIKGDLDIAALQALTGKAVAIDDLNGVFVVREDVDPFHPEKFRLWVHEKSLEPIKAILESPVAQERAMAMAVLLAHESLEGTHDSRFNGGRVLSHSWLEANGFTFNALTQDLKAGKRSTFLDSLSTLGIYIFENELAKTREGVLRTGSAVRVAYNIKRFVAGMESLYGRADDWLRRRYGTDRVKITRSIEKPDERKHDFPGFLGIVGRLIEDVGDIQRERIVVVSDGGSKTRPGGVTLAYGYAGLWPLLGPAYDSLRDFGMLMTATIGDALPGGLAKWIGWTASDNLVILGANPAIGAKRLGALNGDDLRDASVIKGGARVIDFLTQSDIDALNAVEAFNQPDEWWLSPQERVRAALGAEAWDRIKEKIRYEKLSDLGTLAADMSGRMVAFTEKEKDARILVRMFYEAARNHQVVYKNPFLEFLGKDLSLALHDVMSRTSSIGSPGKTLDQLPVSYMQTVYQSHLTTERYWELIWEIADTKAKKAGKQGNPIHHDDWMKYRELVERVFERERAAGRGEIYVLDYGNDYIWEDVGNLEQWRDALSRFAQLPRLRALFGISSNRQGRISLSATSRVSDQAYLENVEVSGEGHLVVTEKAALKNVRLNIPKGRIVYVGKNAVLEEVDIDLSTLVGDSSGASTFLRFGDNSISQRVFTEGLTADPVIGVSIPADTFLTTLKVDGTVRSYQNLVRVPKDFSDSTDNGDIQRKRAVAFKEETLGSIVGSEASWEQWKKRYPFLPQVPFEDVKSKDFFSIPDPQLNGKTFTQAQEKGVDFTWSDKRTHELREALSGHTNGNSPRFNTVKAAQVTGIIGVATGIVALGIHSVALGFLAVPWLLYFATSEDASMTPISKLRGEVVGASWLSSFIEEVLMHGAMNVPGGVGEIVAKGLVAPVLLPIYLLNQTVGFVQGLLGKRPKLDAETLEVYQHLRQGGNTIVDFSAAPSAPSVTGAPVLALPAASNLFSRIGAVLKLSRSDAQRRAIALNEARKQMGAAA